MADNGVLSGTPAQLLGALEQINIAVSELARIHGARPDPYTWTGWLQEWHVDLAKSLLSLDFVHLLGTGTRTGSVRVPVRMPGVEPTPVRIGTEGPLGASAPWLLMAGEEYQWDWPVDRLHIYPGMADLAWPAATFITIRTWRGK